MNATVSCGQPNPDQSPAMLASALRPAKKAAQGRGIRKPYAASRIQRKPMPHTSPLAELWSVRTCRPSSSVTCAIWSLRSDSPACPSPVFAARDGRIYGLSSRLFVTGLVVVATTTDYLRRMLQEDVLVHTKIANPDMPAFARITGALVIAVGGCWSGYLAAAIAIYWLAPLATHRPGVLESWSSVPATSL